MNEVIQGDLLDVLPDMENDSVDLVVTSPPYNVNIDYGSYKDDLPHEEYRQFMDESFHYLDDVVKDNGRVCVNISLKNDDGIVDNPTIIKQLAEEQGWDLRFEIVWYKGQSESSSAWGSWRSPSSPRPIFNHEYIYIFDVGDEKKESEKTISKKRFMNLVKSVWEVKPETVSDHPAAFPIEIPERLIELNSYCDDVILDPFTGSGTTLVAAEKNDRNFVGIEKEQKYVEMARERLQQPFSSDPKGEVVGVFDY